MGPDVIHVRDICYPFVPGSLVLYDIMSKIFHKYFVTPFDSGWNTVV
jgi:hypothetical protein